MSRPTFELVHATVVKDAAATLLGEISTPRIPPGSRAVVAIQPSDASDEHYVFEIDDWLKLIDLLALEPRRLSHQGVKDLLAYLGKKATIVMPGEQPHGAAIVQSGDEIVGVWIAKDRRRRTNRFLAPTGGVLGTIRQALANQMLSRRSEYQIRRYGYESISEDKLDTDLRASSRGARRRPARDAYIARRKTTRGHSPEAIPGEQPPSRPRAPVLASPEAQACIAEPTGEEVVEQTLGLAATTTETLRRTPHIDVPDTPLSAGSSFLAKVYTDEQAAQPGEIVEGISLVGDKETYHLYVWLLVSEHFELEGEPIRSFTIGRSQPRSESIEYSIRVVDHPPSGSEPSISAVFLNGGRQAGKVERQVRVAKVAEAVPPPGRHKPEPTYVGLDRRPAAPDLTVVISRPGRGHSYECAISTPHLDQYSKPVTEPWGFPDDASVLVNQRLERFAEQGLGSLKRRARLVGAGKALYEDVPRLFRKVYGDLATAGKPIQSILIATEEPAFPWELLVPDDRDPRPLGVRHSIGRWTHPKQLPTRQHLKVRDGYVIAPDYPTEKRRLIYAEAEVKFVCDKLSCSRVDPPSVKEVNAALARQPVSLLHFVCHGAAPDGNYAQSIYLLHEVDGKLEEEELDDEMLRGLTGVEHGVKEGTPLVFLNACEAGRLLPSLMGTGGLAKTFITLGACGVIAPLWRVRDTLAAKIALQIYQTAIDSPDTPLAEILRRVRTRTYDEPEAEDSFAAYCFFGDPHARLERIVTGEL